MLLILKLKELISERFPQYGLYVYGEGEIGAALEKKKYSGIPVLFIPGNSGSHKQVRSLASVALRKAIEESGYETHFDYFAVDFNEEFSALYGGSLGRQTEYVALCVDHILGLYKKSKKPRPRSIVLVGHSIGGLIAKSLFARPAFDTDKVSAVVTLATPHDPVLVMDSYTREFYDAVESHWASARARPPLKDVTFASIGGGERDIQVRSGLTTSGHADVNVITTDVPAVWVSTDHRCIVWCKQLVLAINRALFDSIDPEAGQITADPEHRRQVFRYHFLERKAGKRYRRDEHPETLNFDRDGFWTDVLKRQFEFSRKHVSSNSYIMVKVLDDPKHKYLTVDAVNLENPDWVFGCKALKVYKATRICESGDNLSKMSQLLPSNGKRKAVTLDLHKLGKDKGYTHVVVFVPKHAENLRVNVDVYGENDRHLPVAVPRWISFWNRQPVVEETLPKAVFYNVSLQNLEEPWQAYNVFVTPLSGCETKKEEEGGEKQHFGLMRMITPWSRDSTQTLVVSNMTNMLTARLQTPRPKKGYFPNPEVRLYLDPACRYKIEIQSTLPGMWGQIVRFYLPMLLPLSVSVLLVTLAQQLRSFDSEGNFPDFISTITTKVSPMSAVLPSRLLGSLLGMSLISAYVPMTDPQRMALDGTDFGVLPILLFFVSIGLVTIVGTCAWLSVLVFGHAAGKVASRFLAPQNEVVAEVAMEGLSKFPFLLSAILIGVAASTCGSLALCLGTFCHFVHLFDMFKGHVISRIFPDSDDGALGPLHFQLTISLLWAFASVLNVPSLMAWTRSIPFETQLNPDPSLITAVVLSSALAVTWKGPRKAARMYSKLAFALQFMAILIVMYGSVSVFRANYFISAAFTLVAVHQLVATDKPPQEASKDNEDARQSNTEVPSDEKVSGDHDSSGEEAGD